MIDDQVGHHLDRGAQGAQIFPIAQTRIDRGVIDRIESGVGSIDRKKEWQQMHAAEQLPQWPAEQGGQARQAALNQAVDISDKLDLVLHGGVALARCGCLTASGGDQNSPIRARCALRTDRSVQP